MQGKHALVTAAAKGIGAATARAFAEAGAQVLATDIDASALAELASLPNTTVLPLDVTDAAAIDQLVEQVPTVDVLFNCAGMVHHGSILDCTDRDWDLAFELNVKSMYRLTRACLPGMLAAGGGSIINISSIAGIRGLPNRFVYGASKAAVLGLTKAIAADHVGQGIRCNAICPGTVQTPSLDDRINAFDDPQQARAQFIARQPMGRLGTPEEIAAIAVYLASDESVFTTGNHFSVDGGMTI